MIRNTKYYRINHQITAPKLRVLDETGKQIGVLDRFEALRKAQSEEKDLVEISAHAVPPVVKLIDFKKFKYLEAKKLKEARKNVKHVGVKEIRLSPFMGQHDFQVRVNQGLEFLKDGNQLKISLPFRGREITKKEFGMQVIKRAIEQLGEASKVTKEPHFEGRVLVSMLAPFKSAKKQDAKTENEEINTKTV